MDEFGVKLVVNPEYGTRNNLYSLLRAKEKLGGSYLLPCDLWCAENPFRRYELYSWYMVSDAQSEESDVRVTRARELAPAKPGQAGARMVGIAYFTPRDGVALRKSMETLEATGLHKNDFGRRRCLRAVSLRWRPVWCGTVRSARSTPTKN